MSGHKFEPETVRVADPKAAIDFARCDISAGQGVHGDCVTGELPCQVFNFCRVSAIETRIGNVIKTALLHRNAPAARIAAIHVHC